MNPQIVLFHKRTLPYFSFLLFPSFDGTASKALTLICAVYVLGWYVSERNINDPLLLLSISFFHSTQFLKFMFLYIHLVLTAAGFSSVCIYHILLIHSQADRHLGCPNFPASKQCCNKQLYICPFLYQ